MNTPGRSSPPRWADYFVAGRMPLWSAVIFGFWGSIGASLALADLSLGTIAGYPIIFVFFVLPPASAVPFLARYKRRSVVRWVPVGFIALAFSLFAAFLPLMVMLSLVFARRVDLKIPEAEMEANEDRQSLQTLLRISEDIGVLRIYFEELILRHDYREIAVQYAHVDAIGTRMEQLPRQISGRGRRARIQVNTALLQLLKLTTAADDIAKAIVGQPSLERIARGDEGEIKGKQEKALQRQLRGIEAYIDHCRNLGAIAEVLLEELGVTLTAKPQMVEAHQSLPESSGPMQPTAALGADKRARRRPRRRTRF